VELDVGHAILLRPGDGETISDRAERTVLIKAGIDAITVTETRYEAGEEGPEPHIHRRHTDAFYVLEGTIVFGLGPDVRRMEAAAGSFVAAPPGVVHTFRNDGPARARYLNFHAPSERFHDHLREARDGLESSWFDQDDPPEDGGRPVSDAVALGPGEGERIDVGGSSVLVKGASEGTDGELFLSETTIAPGFPGPPPHVHRRLHDLFYVLDGTLTVHVAGDEVEAGPGTFACFPPGVVHTFANPTAERVRFLNFNTPAGWEGYMRDLGAAFSGERQPTSAEIGAIAARYDFEPA
jgi:mannose-6-phosphate isomerase-like protein (cupin superfamily)